MHISDRNQKLFGIEMTSDHDHIYIWNGLSWIYRSTKSCLEDYT
jgi:hypothetical protein